MISYTKIPLSNKTSIYRIKKTYTLLYENNKCINIVGKNKNLNSENNRKNIINDLCKFIQLYFCITS